MTTEYCNVNELLTGDLGGTEGMRPLYVTMASEEMDSMIGFVYALPLPLASLAEHIQLLLKNICRKIATGRLLLAQAVGNEENSVHAYGKSLLDEGLRDLWAIRNGQIDIGAPRIDASGTSSAPVIIEGDAVSAVDAFYGWIAHPPVYPVFHPTIWEPGR